MIEPVAGGARRVSEGAPVRQAPCRRPAPLAVRLAAACLVAILPGCLTPALPPLPAPAAEKSTESAAAATTATATPAAAPAESAEPVEVADDEEDAELERLLDEEFEDDLERQAPRDPWEPFNRGVFAFNQAFDRWLMEPVLRGYRFVIPQPGRKAIFRLVRNLRSPAIFANHAFQLRFGDAATTLGRFVLNSTVGVGGLFDAAEIGAGWEYEPGDFGQTLGRYGVPSGPYLLIPILGPSSVRDFVGTGADFMLDPMMYLVGPLWLLPMGVGRGFVEIDAYHEDLERLEDDSLDFYAAMHSVYHQSREAAVRRAVERSCWQP